MLVKPTVALDRKLSFAGTLLIKPRTELAAYLISPEHVLGIHHAGVGIGASLQSPPTLLRTARPAKFASQRNGRA